MMHIIPMEINPKIIKTRLPQPQSKENKMKTKRSVVFVSSIKNDIIKLSTLLIVVLNITHTSGTNYSLSGNHIWDDLLQSCRNASSGYLCVQNNLVRYVDNVLLNTEFYVSDSFYFKNKINNTSHFYQVPENFHQTSYPSDSSDDDAVQFSSFIDELESVEQELDADKKKVNAKAKRKNAQAFKSENISETNDKEINESTRQSVDSDYMETNGYSNGDESAYNEQDSNTQDRTNGDDWKSVETTHYVTPKGNTKGNGWNINLKDVVNRKPEWNGHIPRPAFENEASEGISLSETGSDQDSWVPKPSANTPTKKKLSSRIKHGKSIDLVNMDNDQDEGRENSTEKSKVPKHNSKNSVPSDTKFPSKDDIEENMIPDSEHMPEAPYKSIYDVSAMFYEKSVNYFMNHDLIFFLPKFMFGGAQITLSPKGIEADGGINLRLDINPLMKQENPNGQSRLFFKHMHKMFKHKIKHKLMSSLIALMMIIKMIKMKIWFVLPLLIGVGAAKKLLLKVLLFLFPALAHLFKLCSYYHHHATRLHLHHHKIKHHHHHVGVPIPIPPPYDPHSSYHESHHGSYHSGPPGIVETGVELDHPPPGYEVYGAGGGPPGHSEYYPSRNDQVGNKLNQHGNVFDSWGLNDIFPTESPGVLPAAAQAYSGYVDDSITALNKMAANNKLQQAAIAAQSVTENSSYNAYLSKLARLQALKQKNYQSAAAGGPVGGVSHAPTSKYSSAAIFQNTIAPKPPTQVIQQPAPPQIQQPAQHHQHHQSVDYDAFFSPILGKVDQIFTSMGVYDEPCRERLVCNMYRTPNKYSPHSNLVSNELSRDPSELPKAAKISVPALRFYKYVQAARDGQDNNDCAKLYATCSKSL